MINPFFLRAALCCVISFCTYTLFALPLTGTKTIGGTSPDYATFTAAVADLNLNGVGTGGVTFSMRDGSYSGGISILVTATQANAIVFQSENLDATLVSITNSNTTDVIILEGTSYITFRKLTIDYTSGSGNSAIEIRDNSDFVTIDGCIINGAAVSSTAFASSAIYASESTAPGDCSNFVAQNCTIRNGSYGIYFGTTASQGLNVQNNRFEEAYAGGVYLDGVAAPTISGNTITTTQTGNPSYYGIRLDGCNGKNIITGNYIYTSGAGEIGYGINLTGSASSSGNNALIVNNSIQISNTASIAIGIDQSNNSTFYDIIGNTIFVSGGTNSSTYAYRTFTFSDDTKIKNNIFANFALGTLNTSNLTVLIANATGVSEASHNNYWTGNTGTPFRANYNGAYTTLSAYTAALGEVSAMNIDPQMTFVTDVGWKATNSALTGGGVYFAAIPTDIDGKTRLNPTTIGAHENGNSTPTPPANDDICGATVIIPGVAIAYTNIDATAETSEPVPPVADCAMGWCPGDGVVQNSVWFTFTMAENKRIRITTTGFDNQVTLYSASSCSTSFTFAAASDISGAPGEIFSICVSAGRCYIQIDGYQGASGSGTVTLTELTLNVPAIANATNEACTSFTANWNAVSGAITYFLDVASDNTFTNLVPGYSNRNTGNVTSFSVTGLMPATNYYYRVRANDGCVASTGNSILASPRTADVAGADYFSSVNGFTATFFNATSGSPTSFLWIFGDGNTSTDTNPTHTYASQGNYQVQLIATNACGSDTITQTANVNCTPVNVNISTNYNKVFCDGDSAVLATIHSQGNTYQWLRDNQPISGANTFNYTALISGDYALSVTNLSNCSGVSDSITIVANSNPVVAIAANGPTAFCEGNEVELSTTSTELAYQWLNNLQTIDNANNAAYTATTAGNYYLSVTDANNCTGVSNQIAVVVNDLPAVSLVEYDTVCQESGATITVLGGGTPNGGGYYVDGIPSTHFQVSGEPGVYEIRYEYTDGNGCTNFATRDLVLEVCSGLDNISGENIFISPNPASEVITIKINGNLPAENIAAYLFDAAGKEALTHVLTNRGANTMNVQELPEGVYFLQLISAGKMLHETKVSVIR